MNDKRAKALRRFATLVANKHGLSSTPLYALDVRQASVIVVNCRRSVYLRLKRNT